MSEEKAEISFPIIYDKCPWCGCKDTVARLAVEGSKDIAPGTFVSLVKITVNLLENVPKGLTYEVLLVHKDICANPECGRERVTKVEKLTVPSENFYKMMAQAQGILPSKGNDPPGFRPRH